MADEGRQFIARNPLSPLSETIFAAKVFRCEADIAAKQFPTASQSVNDHGKHEIDHRFVANIEAKLHSWHEGLPQMSSIPLNDRAMRSQLALRYCHAAVQMMLYCPFVHHVVRSQEDPSFNYQSYALGSACIARRCRLCGTWMLVTGM